MFVNFNLFTFSNNELKQLYFNKRATGKSEQQGFFFSFEKLILFFKFMISAVCFCWGLIRFVSVTIFNICFILLFPNFCVNMIKQLNLSCVRWKFIWNKENCEQQTKLCHVVFIILQLCLLFCVFFFTFFFFLEFCVNLKCSYSPILSFLIAY